MARTPQDVTVAELKVLELLWERGPATVRQITDALYPDGGASKYATVQKLLERLEEAEFVARDRSGGVQSFAATVGREALIDRRLQNLAEQLCGGSLTPLLTHLVKADRLSADEIQSLRNLIDELDEPAPRRNRRSSK
ncbi:MAG: BlaI/MecI/CopY family transcriptional regulator [Gemmataceae bacterium]